MYAEEIDERGVDTQEMNLYAYVRNNPIKYVDPSGEELGSFFAMLSRAGALSQVSSEAKSFTKAYVTAATVAVGI